MKLQKALVSIVLFSLVLCAAGFAGAAKQTDWDVFSKNLVKNLKSDNEGVKLSSMQQVIRYADNLKVDAGIFQIVNIYRTHPELKVRQLALTTLHKTNNRWAINFLKRNFEYEKSPILKAQIYHILNDVDPGSVYAKKVDGQVEFATR
jgi:hypothetical protein